MLTEWKVFSLKSKDLDFRQYFDSTELAEKFPEVDFKILTLKEVRIGASKVDSDTVELDLNMYETAGYFGRFVKFIVTETPNVN